MIDASPAGLVAVWEQACELPRAERDRALLGLDAGNDADTDAWTLGRRDAVLAQLFRRIYGEFVEATVRCGACDAWLEFQTTIGALFGSAAAGEAAEPGPFCIRHDGYEVTLAPLRACDLRALPQHRATAVAHVLQRCVLAAQRGGGAVEIERLPAAVQAAISAALAAADPRAETFVMLACECGHEGRVAFDIGTFLWEALDRGVAQTLADVHVLAGAYGWTEGAILALPERRRRHYLGLLAG